MARDNRAQDNIRNTGAVPCRFRTNYCCKRYSLISAEEEEGKLFAIWEKNQRWKWNVKSNVSCVSSPERPIYFAPRSGRWSSRYCNWRRTDTASSSLTMCKSLDMNSASSMRFSKLSLIRKTGNCIGYERGSTMTKNHFFG